MLICHWPILDHYLSVGYIFLSRYKEHTGIGPAISGGDFPQHQCAGQSPAAPLIPTGDEATPPPSVAVTANKPLTSRKDQNKQQQVAASTSNSPAEFDLQGLIDSEIEEVKSPAVLYLFETRTPVE